MVVCMLILCKKLNFITIYTAYIYNHSSSIYSSSMHRRVFIPAENAIPLFISLGNDAIRLVGNDTIWYVIIPHEITLQIRTILSQYNTFSLEITEDELNALMETTPMALANAIRMGQIVDPGKKYQHVWETVCESAGIVKVPLSSIAQHALANGVQKAKDVVANGAQKATVAVANGTQKATVAVANGAYYAFVYCLSCAITVYNSPLLNRK